MSEEENEGGSFKYFLARSITILFIIIIIVYLFFFVKNIAK